MTYFRVPEQRTLSVVLPLTCLLLDGSPCQFHILQSFISNRHETQVFDVVATFLFSISRVFYGVVMGPTACFFWSQAPVGNAAEDRPSHSWTNTKKWVGHIFKAWRVSQYGDTEAFTHTMTNVKWYCNILTANIYLIMTESSIKRMRITAIKIRPNVAQAVSLKLWRNIDFG